MTVTERSHPKLFSALLLMVYDGGGANRFEPTIEAMLVPPSAERFIEAAERGLATLSAEDLTTLAIGERTEAKEVALRDPDLICAFNALDIFYEFQI